MASGVPRSPMATRHGRLSVCRIEHRSRTGATTVVVLGGSADDTDSIAGLDCCRTNGINTTFLPQRFSLLMLVMTDWGDGR